MANKLEGLIHQQYILQHLSLSTTDCTHPDHIDADLSTSTIVISEEN